MQYTVLRGVRADRWARRPGARPALAALAAVLGGCTHLETFPDRLVSADSFHALPGATYALPMLQYDLTVTRTLAGCPSKLRQGPNDPALDIWSDDLKFENAVTAVPNQIAGERYRVDYTKLDGWTKTTSFTIEYQPGTEILKSINATAEDHSSEIIGNTVKAGLAAAAVVAGPAGVLSVGAALAASAGPAAFAADRKKTEAEKKREASQGLLALIKASSRTRDLLTCSPAAEERIRKSEAIDTAVETDQKELDALTRQVDAATKLAAAHVLNRTRKDSLAADTAKLSTLIDKLAEERASSAKIGGALSVKTVVSWPTRFGDRETASAAALDAAGQAALVEFLRGPQTASVVSPYLLGTSLAGLSKDVLDNYRHYFKDFVANYISDSGVPKVLKPPSPVPGCSEKPVLPTPCVASLTTLTSKLKPVSTDMLPPCPLPADVEDKNECLLTYPRDPTKDQKAWLPPQIDARDNVARRGVFVRPPARATLLICRTPSSKDDANADGCAKGAKNLVKDDKVLAPQFGQLRFFRLDNEMFSNNGLTISITKEGAIETFNYATTKSIAAGLAAAASDAATQAAAFDKERRAEHKANSDPVAALNDRIALLKAQGDLAALENPDPAAALNKQILLKKAQIELAGLENPSLPADEVSRTAALNNELALLTAQKAVIEARAALDAARAAEP